MSRSRRPQRWPGRRRAGPARWAVRGRGPAAKRRPTGRRRRRDLGGVPGHCSSWAADGSAALRLTGSNLLPALPRRLTSAEVACVTHPVRHLPRARAIWSRPWPRHRDLDRPTRCERSAARRSCSRARAGDSGAHPLLDGQVSLKRRARDLRIRDRAAHRRDVGARRRMATAKPAGARRGARRHRTQRVPRLPRRILRADARPAPARRRPRAHRVLRTRRARVLAGWSSSRSASRRAGRRGHIDLVICQEGLASPSIARRPCAALPQPALGSPPPQAGLLRRRAMWSS